MKKNIEKIFGRMTCIWGIINEYIDKCVSVCISQIEALKKGKKGINPKDYYVEDRKKLQKK